MELETSKLFDRDFQKLSLEVKKRARKQFAFLLENWRHPSLRVKKIKSEKDAWEASITKGYRFTFQKVSDNIILLRRIGEHDKVLKNP